MPIKDEELRKIIKILVDKDKEKKARKKARRKRRRATSGASSGGGMPATAQIPSTQGVGGPPGSLMGGFGGVNYWGGGGGGSLGPTRQEIQNLIQSNLTVPPVPLAQPPLALPPSLASENIFDIPERNILTQEEEMALQPAKWTMDEIGADTYGNFADGTGSESFLEPGAVPVATAFGTEDDSTNDSNNSLITDMITSGDLTENYPRRPDINTPFTSSPIAPTSGFQSDYVSGLSSDWDTEGPSFIKTKNAMPSIPEEEETPKQKRKYTRRTPEQIAFDKEQKALRKLERDQRKKEKFLTQELKAFPELAKYSEVMDDAVRNQNLSKLNQGKK